MKYYIEIWLRGFAKDYLRGLVDDGEDKHPHITLVRPFTLTDITEEEIKSEIVKVCESYQPILFNLSSSAYFEQGVNYVPVLDPENVLTKLDRELECSLENKVSFVSKLSDEKNFHATISCGDKESFDVPNIEQYMLRLTLIRDKKIWFSYDFVQREILSREESLDKNLWKQAVQTFLKKENLEITKEGFKKVDN